MHSKEMELASDQQRDRLEVYNTIILAVATLAVAWCSYQANLWNGIQTFCLVDSNKYSRQSQQKSIQAGQTMAMEEGVIISFVDAVIQRDKQKIDFIMKRVKPEIANIMKDWLQTNPVENSSAPINPMTTAAYQELMKKRMDESEKMAEKAQQAFDEAQKANFN